MTVIEPLWVGPGTGGQEFDPEIWHKTKSSKNSHVSCLRGRAFNVQSLKTNAQGNLLLWFTDQHQHVDISWMRAGSITTQPH
jgi:hypothetical protein